MAEFTPVDHDLFGGIGFVPVDHDPFASFGPATGPQTERAADRAAPIAARQGSHHYELSIPLCLGCSPTQAFDRVRSFAALGAGYAPNGTRDVTLTGNNPIRQTVDPEALTITNTTLPGHVFHPGTVRLAVVPDHAGVVSLHVAGSGTGRYPLVNEIVGPIIFFGKGMEAFGVLNPDLGGVP
jgi:hypothetical protein